MNIPPVSLPTCQSAPELAVNSFNVTLRLPTELISTMVRPLNCQSANLGSEEYSLGFYRSLWLQAGTPEPVTNRGLPPNGASTKSRRAVRFKCVHYLSIVALYPSRASPVTIYSSVKRHQTAAAAERELERAESSPEFSDAGEKDIERAQTDTEGEEKHERRAPRRSARITMAAAQLGK
ncbi:hypothetical protein C8F01DRAFT_1091869 [Mycena amicta]|nr:hypothetical protein C8F01DRAFT_1091869 [Mycena amicta]